ncbi:unnamed protein product, partial [Cyprideis torosa]
MLGKGAFGRVFKARRRGTDDVFAIKEIPFPPEDAEKTLREVRAAMELSREDPYILTHHDAWLEDRRTSDEGATPSQGGALQDNQRSLPRGNEEENDEPPTGSSAQGDGYKNVWTSGAEGQGGGSESVWTSGAEAQGGGSESVWTSGAEAQGDGYESVWTSGA